MKIFDTHAHYDSEQFNEDMDDVLQNIHDAKDGIPVEMIMNVGADMASSHSAVNIANRYNYVYAAIGVHPDSAGELIWCPERNEDESACSKNREELKKLAEEDRVAAIGEIGLDYHWDVWPREIQKKAFMWQWNLAAEMALPIIIHSRDAAEDTMNVVRGFYKTLTPGSVIKAVMHCYSYSSEQAEEYLKMGLMFGIGGVVTFKNAKKLKEVVDLLPMDKILLETDCPYMAPEPYRGKRNNSGYLSYVAEKIAEIKGIDVKKVYDCTWENAERFFGLKK